MSYPQEFFNTKVGKIRIKAEHCIGILKGRFSQLKRLRTIIRHRDDMIWIIRVTEVAAILHNLCLNEPIPPHWIDDDSDDEVNDGTVTNTLEVDHSGLVRRDRIFAYILKHFGYN